MPHAELPSEPRRNNNPYQILIVAALFFLPGMAMLLRQEPAAVFHKGGRYAPSTVEVDSVDTLHAYGAALLLMSAGIGGFYFYLRREIRRDESSPHRRRRR